MLKTELDYAQKDQARKDELTRKELENARRSVREAEASHHHEFVPGQRHEFAITRDF